MYKRTRLRWNIQLYVVKEQCIIILLCFINYPMHCLFCVCVDIYVYINKCGLRMKARKGLGRFSLTMPDRTPLPYRGNPVRIVGKTFYLYICDRLTEVVVVIQLFMGRPCLYYLLLCLQIWPCSVCCHIIQGIYYMVVDLYSYYYCRYISNRIGLECELLRNVWFLFLLGLSFLP